MRLLRRFVSFLGWIAVISSAIVLLGLVLLVIFAASGGETKLEYGEVKTDHAVAIVPLTGEIFTAERFREQLKKALESTAIKGVVIQIDSPGGAVGASQELLEAIRRASEKKPIVCSLGNIAASGGLYAAVGCKKIVANPGTLTGSIGVIMMMPNFSTVLQNFGVGMTVVKSGKFKDTGSPFRPTTPEDSQVLQHIVDTAYEQFVSAIATGRGLDPVAVRRFADGRIILGEEAVKIGLVDEVGDVYRAAKIALETSGDTSDPELVWPKRPSGLMRVFGGIDEFAPLSRLEALWNTRLLYQAFL